MELVIAMRYKLQMLGIPVIGSCVLFGDNMSMITSATVPSSSLKKKHNFTWAGIVDLIHVGSKFNIADIHQAFGP